MNAKQKFFRDGLMLSLVGLAVRTAAMLLGAFVSRSIGAEGVGMYTLVMTVYSFAVTFATSGITLCVTRLVASSLCRDESERGSVLSSAFLYSLIFSLAAALTLLFGSDTICRRLLGGAEGAPALKILAFSLPPAAMNAVINGYFIGVKRVSRNAAAQVLGQLSRILLTVLPLSLAMGKGICAAISALALGITLTELLCFALLLCELLHHRRGSRRGRASAQGLCNVAKNTLPVSLSQYVRSALLTLEHILIPERLKSGTDRAATAYADYGTLHGMALPVIMYGMSPLSSFSGLLVPEFASDLSAGNSQRMQRVASMAASAALAYATAVMIFLYSFSEELGYLLYSSYDAGRFVAMLAPVVPIMYLDHVTDSMLKGIGEQVFSMWVNITDSALSIILVWFLIPPLGISGYALVIVIMEAYNFLLSFIRLRKRIPFGISLFHSLLLPLACSVMAVGLADSLFAVSGSSFSTLWLVMKMLFAAAMLVAALTLSRLACRRQPLPKEKM